MNFRLIPNEEILSKFLKTNFELVNEDIAGLDASNQYKQSNNNEFEK